MSEDQIEYKNEQNRTTVDKKAMIEALEKSLGVVTTACKTVGISRSTHYEWYKEDANYRAEVDSLAEMALDFAESQLHKQIQNGEVTSTIFFLKCKGKKRGYVERQEMAISNGPENEFTIRVVNSKSEIQTK